MVSISCNFLVSVVNVGSGFSVSGSSRVQNSRVLVGSGEFSTKLQPSTTKSSLSE